jgi:hypothetical protein
MIVAVRAASHSCQRARPASDPVVNLARYYLTRALAKNVIAAHVQFIDRRFIAICKFNEITMAYHWRVAAKSITNLDIAHLAAWQW